MFRRLIVCAAVLFGSLLASQQAEANGFGVRRFNGFNRGFAVKNGFGHAVGFNHGYGFNNFAFNNFAYGNAFAGGYGNQFGYGTGCGTDGFGGYGSAFVSPVGVYPGFSGYGVNNNAFFGRRIVRDRFGRVFAVRGFGY